MRRLLCVLLVVSGLGLVGQGDVPCSMLPPQPKCYVALFPGPTEDTLGIVEVSSAATYSSSGELLLTTVSLEESLTPARWLRTLLSAPDNLLRREVLFPPGLPDQDLRRRTVSQMDASQRAATAAALRNLGYQVELGAQGAEVVEVLPDQPGAGRLVPGDVIVTVDGAAVEGADAFVATIARHRVGDRITLGVRSPPAAGGQARDLQLTLAPSTRHEGAPAVGAVLRDHVVLPVDVRIHAGSVVGPSAGLMFALAIVDLLTPDDLTGGHIIAGTGTIDAQGRVGPIGGIQQKIRGAVDRGARRPATVFLVPQDNFRQAQSTPVDHTILLVPVRDLQDALRALRELREGGLPADAYALGAH